jgi:MFS family permease
MRSATTHAERCGTSPVLAIFALHGVIFGSWAPRMPALANHVHATEGSLGLALLGGSLGMITSASLVGRLCAGVGARAVTLSAALGSAVALPLIALAPSTVLLGLALAGLGAAAGALDVSMNIAAVTVVRRTRRPLMPVFHAAFSFGALLGAAGAALAAAVGWGTPGHLAVVAALSALVALAAGRRVPNAEVLMPTRHRPAGPSLARRPVLWLLASVALFSAVAEGASADWSALFAVTARGLGEGSAALIYAGFSIAMAVTRLLGEPAERRWGGERLLAFGAAVAGGGLMLAVLVPSAWASFAGFALAGAGLAYAFPVALELAGVAGRRLDGSGGEREIAFVTAIAYSGLLLGPPMIGGIAQVSSLTLALGVAGMLTFMIAPAVLAAASARRRENDRVPGMPTQAPAPCGATRGWTEAV